MKAFHWSTNLETGISIIDEQHKRIFKKIDDLILDIYQDKKLSLFLSQIKEIESILNDHFKTEEEFFILYDYSGAPKHKMIHIQFFELIKSLLKDVTDATFDKYLCIKIEKEIRVWWYNHIINEDFKYIPYLKDDIE